MTDIKPLDGRMVNWPLLNHLATKPHRLLNIADDFEAQIRSIPIAWTGEVFQEARNAHHLFDMVGIPTEADSTPALDLDARAYLAIAEIIGLRERLDRIARWHARETGPGGTVGDLCAECGTKWPCASRQLAEGVINLDL